MTVILNDDKDISAGDLRQLAQSSSEIGIEIDSLELDSSDDLPESSDSTAEKNSQDSGDLLATVDDAARSGNDEYPTNSQGTLDGRTLSGETGNDRSFSCASKEAGKNQSFAYISREGCSDWETDETSKRDRKLKNMHLKYEQSVGDEVLNTTEQKTAETPLFYNTLPRESDNRIEEESCYAVKGKRSCGKNGDGGKGLFSRLKNIRKSFRGKKGEGKNLEKSGKASRNSVKKIEKREKTPDTDIRGVLDSRSLTRIDDNSNEMNKKTNKPPKSRDLTASPEYRTKVVRKDVLAVTDEKSRRLNEALRQSGATLRRVVGVKSISSDHLNSLRINQPSGFEISAKSLEVLLETCI